MVYNSANHGLSNIIGRVGAAGGAWRPKTRRWSGPWRRRSGADPWRFAGKQGEAREAAGGRRGGGGGSRDGGGVPRGGAWREAIKIDSCEETSWPGCTI